MPGFIELFAPLALLLPIPAGDEAVPASDTTEVAPASPAQAEDVQQSGPWMSTTPFSSLRPWYQVRIQQRVIVRVSPRRTDRQSLVATLPSRKPEAYVERKMGSCLLIRDVVAVQADAARLLLYTRDRKIVSATLDKSCRPRDFYSGFYVEPSKDGKLCVKRDNLQSRSGVSCQMSKIRQLIPAGV